MSNPNIAKRLYVLENLLAVETSVHPPHCDCAIKSREVTHHDPSCQYRQLKEIIAELRDLSRGGENPNG